MLALFGTPALAGDSISHDSSRTTLSIFNDLGSEAGMDIASAAHFQSGDSVGIHSVSSGNDAWIIQNAVTSSLRSRGCVLFNGDTVSVTQHYYRLEIFSSEMNVRYGDVFRDGMFGTQKAPRNVSVSVQYKCSDSRTEQIIADGIVRKSAVDTVLVDEIPSLENPGVKSTHGDFPSGQFLDKIVEPFIIIGSAGVIVYLFFHVRS